MNNNNNLAYDLTKYEDVAPEKTPKIRIHRRRAENTGSVPSMIALAAAVGILLGAVIYGKVEEASIHAEITAQTQYVEMLNSEHARMRTELEEKTALKSVETYVEDVLGMQKLDKSQIEYVSISNGSVVDIPENDDNIFVRIKHTLSDFLEYIRG